MVIEREKSPFILFERWLHEAEQSEPKYFNAMTLATVGADGMPSARVVLLKDLSDDGFVFYTNYESDKGRELLTHKKAALSFYWKTLDRQIRIRGDVTLVTDAEADAYFATRPRQSQLGAWASKQSTEIGSRADLEARYREFEKTFEGRDVTRPAHWSGFRLVPRDIEFWSEGAYRLHDRLVYRRDGSGWTLHVLSP
ncbi:pyridoxamine 5'-phosphate oxidase [soil metagenome]